MRKVAIGTVANVTAGQAAPKKNEFSDIGIPFVRAGSLENLLAGECETDLELVPAETAKKRKLKLYPKGSILFAKSGMSATKDRIYILQDPAFVVSHLAILTSKDNVYWDYLRLALKQFPPSNLIKDRNYPSIGLEEIQGYEIPVPENLEDQKRIAHLLGKVEALIARRKQHLQQLDDLLKSIFLEMFGPQAHGYDDWQLVEIKELAAKHKGAMRTGPFGSNLLHSEFTSEGDVAVLGIDNAVQNRFAWGERRFITNEKYKELENYRIFPGDIIITIMGTIGRSAVIPDDIPIAINTKHLAAVTLDKKIANPVFVSYSIHSNPFILNQFKSKTRGAIMSGLNLGLIKETKLKRPPIELQDQFATIHKKINNTKSRYQQSLTDLESLYGALSQKAFKGELDMSRVPLPAEGSDTSEEEKIDTKGKQPSELPFELPAPTDPSVLQHQDNRNKSLEHWLAVWLEQLSNEPFEIQPFMEAANQRLNDLADEQGARWGKSIWGEASWGGDPDSLGVGEYDQIKAWVFMQIESGKLKQTRDIIHINEKRQFGNQVILRARKSRL